MRALTCANRNNFLPQRDIQRHHHGKTEHYTPCAEMRMFGKVCVRNQIFHDDKYHCACRKRQKPWLCRREICRKKIPDDSKYRFHRPATHAV